MIGRAGEVVIDPKARELLLKARLLRFFALIFAFAGMVIFVILYFKNVGGTFFSSMTDPSIITIILFPFLPAAVLSFMASRLEREYTRKYTQKK